MPVAGTPYCTPGRRIDGAQQGRMTCAMHRTRTTCTAPPSPLNSGGAIINWMKGIDCTALRAASLNVQTRRSAVPALCLQQQQVRPTNALSQKTQELCHKRVFRCGQTKHAGRTDPTRTSHTRSKRRGLSQDTFHFRSPSLHTTFLHRRRETHTKHSGQEAQLSARRPPPPRGRSQQSRLCRCWLPPA